MGRYTMGAIFSGGSVFLMRGLVHVLKFLLPSLQRQFLPKKPLMQNLLPFALRTPDLLAHKQPKTKNGSVWYLEGTLMKRTITMTKTKTKKQNAEKEVECSRILALESVELTYPK